MGELEDLRQAIRALQLQRPSLGDSVVDSATFPLLERLAELEAQSQPIGPERRLVTAMFVDIVKSTQLSHSLEPDQALEVIDGALSRMAQPVQEYGGQVTRFMGDGFLAVFGLAVARENDARQAVRAGLAIQEVARDYAIDLDRKYRITGFSVRVGINTGLVAAGGLSAAEDKVMGLPVNLAARLEKAAPPGGVLISHYTYQHVRGAFEVEPRASVVVAGFDEPVPAYRVRSAMPRTFRTVTRGVEGVETHMIGRDAELKQLQDAFEQARQHWQTHLVTVVGEAGVGKSRLLYELDRWLSHRPTRAIAFKARGTPQTMSTPFSLLRELFNYRLAIRTSDGAPEMRRKLETGFAAFLDDESEMKAHIVGALLGFDFKGSPHLRGVENDPGQLRERALFYLTQFIAAVAERAPTVLMLDDIHWADAPSLLVILHVIRECPHLRLLAVCLARPALFEGHPTWGSESQAGAATANQVMLAPLPRQACEQLLDEILDKVEEERAGLRDLVLSAAEGNPFYVEELIQMMVDDEVIRREGQIGMWQVDHQRLGHLRVPATLTAVVQARLDSLPPAEKAVLQQASVVGRVFWGAALAALRADGQLPAAELDALARRGLIDCLESSTFAETNEYRFHHAMLRNVAYETVLTRSRTEYHGQVAAWLVQATQLSGRSDELAAVIAEHHDQAGDYPAAAAWYLRAGARAQAQGAPAEACAFFDRALALLPTDDAEGRWQALLGRDEALGALGRTEARIADDLALVAMAQQLQDDARQAEAYVRQGYYLGITGRYPEELAAYQKGLAAARRAGDRRLEARVLGLKVVCESRLGDMHSAAATAEAALAASQEAGDEGVKTLHNVAVFYTESRDLARAAQLLIQQVTLNQQRGNRQGEAVGLLQLGYTYVLLGLYPLAATVLQRSILQAAAIGHRIFDANAGLNLALAEWRLGDTEAAQRELQRCTPVLSEVNDVFGQAASQVYLALLEEQQGRLDDAVACFSRARDALLKAAALGYAHDARAGIARCRLAQGDLASARQNADAVWDYLSQHGGQGLEFPVLAYETCADVFAAAGDTDAERRAIEAGYQQLQACAEKIGVPEWRHSFLENVPEHRRMAQRWLQTVPGPS